jgi:hypothetical protein
MVRLTTWFPMQPRPTATRWYIPLISTVSPPVVVGVGVNKADNGGRGRGHLPRNYSSSNVLNVTSTFFFFRYLLLIRSLIQLAVKRTRHTIANHVTNESGWMMGFLQGLGVEVGRAALVLVWSDCCCCGLGFLFFFFFFVDCAVENYVVQKM